MYKVRSFQDKNLKVSRIIRRANPILDDRSWRTGSRADHFGLTELGWLPSEALIALYVNKFVWVSTISSNKLKISWRVEFPLNESICHI